MENEASSPMPSAPTGGNKSIGVLLAILIVLLVAGGAYWFMQGKAEAPLDSGTTTQSNSTGSDTIPTTDQQPTSTDTIVPPTTDQTNTVTNPDGTSAEITLTTEPSTKTFDVSAANFSFSLKEIKVKKGDTVKITFTNNEGFHDWVLDEFDAKTDRLAAGKSQTIEFVANQTGTFEYYCSVGTHRQMGMKGNLIVE